MSVVESVDRPFIWLGITVVRFTVWIYRLIWSILPTNYEMLNPLEANIGANFTWVIILIHIIISKFWILTVFNGHIRSKMPLWWTIQINFMTWSTGKKHACLKKLELVLTEYVLDIFGMIFAFRKAEFNLFQILRWGYAPN